MKLLLTIIVAMIAAVAASAQSPQKATQGNLDYYPDFKSELYHPCNITVWTPSDYSDEQGYAVLYMHDGQMLFDQTTTWNHQTWNVDSVADAMQSNGSTRPFIVVGIDNTSRRLYEYIPRKVLDYLPPTDTLLARYPKNEFTSDDYLKFIVSELKPFIDSTYSTLSDRENTAIMGSSAGGLISLYAICEYPEIFGAAACLSTHIAMIPDASLSAIPIWAKSLQDYLNDNIPTANTCKIYMDHGDLSIDQLYVPYQPQINSIFESKGWDALHFNAHYYPNTTHSETDWQQRLHIPLTYIFPSYKR